jgi:GntR family transcriptional regulator
VAPSDISRIDRSSPVPLYFQLSRLLTEDIVRHRWARGERMMSEPELSSHFGVSRATVRQALQRLESEGLTRRIKGRGTFVAESRERSWLLQSSGGFFHEEVDRLGLNVTSKVLRAEVGPLAHWPAETLGRPVGSDGVILDRLRYVDGRVALFVADYLPPHLADSALSLGQQDGSLYDRLEEREGVTVYGGRRTLEALKAEQPIADLLEVKLRTPLIFIESISWDAELRPFHAFQLWLRTDRIRVEVQVTRTQSADAHILRTAAPALG